MIHIVILAGGQGTRFWPMSRTKKPKQFLSLGTTKESLLQATVRRVSPFINSGKLWVVTNEIQSGLVKEHVPNANIIIEPIGKNTAPSIALAAGIIGKEDPTGVMIVLPADHSVTEEKSLIEILKEGVELASSGDSLVTIGVEPTSPNTGYGYIKKGNLIKDRAFKVVRFFEKPSLERAVQYLESGDFLWNSGMFMWSVNSIEQAIKEHLPALYESVLFPLKSGKFTVTDEALIKAFENIESVSIDIGILEHSKKCAVISGGNFGWNDVGSWDAWAANFTPDEFDNLVHGDALLLESSGCVVHSEKRFTAVVGAEDLIVIDTGDALLVCSREHVQDVRKVVAVLQQKNRTDLI